ncbi:MAG: hypothetical protein U0V04_20405 [Spirosomataceae bacterium]
MYKQGYVSENQKNIMQNDFSQNGYYRKKMRFGNILVARHFRRPFLMIVSLLTFNLSHSQTLALPKWFYDSFKSKGMEKKYSIAAFLKPSFLQADFNGDSALDIALPVFEKATKRKGILLVHGNTSEHFVFGAGKDFGFGGKDFRWADKWALFTENTAQETQFNKESGDIIGGKTIKLERNGILIEDYEDGSVLSGGIIYWTGNKYIWIHQGE